MAYGLATYALFLATSLYSVAFVGHLPLAPKTLDRGAPDPLLPALDIDAALLGIFAVPHSVMARQGFKRWWTQFAPRSTSCWRPGLQEGRGSEGSPQAPPTAFARSRSANFCTLPVLVLGISANTT